MAFAASSGAVYLRLVTDRIVSPPEYAHSDYAERLVYLEPSYHVNSHALTFADVQPDAATATAVRARFGLPEHALLVASYNQFFKIDVGTARAWVELLRRCRSCVLFLAELDHAKASLSL
jgi:predicted O-linked N-acetylglucosamine transferase (SPINDLY family)